MKKVKCKIAYWDNVVYGKSHGNFSYSLTLCCINDIKQCLSGRLKRCSELVEIC